MAFNGRVEIRGEWEEAEIVVRDLQGDTRDLPFDGDTVYVLSEPEYLELRERAGE